MALPDPPDACVRPDGVVAPLRLQARVHVVGALVNVFAGAALLVGLVPNRAGWD